MPPAPCALAHQVQHWSAELTQARVLQRAAGATASGAHGDGAMGGAVASTDVGGVAAPELVLTDDAALAAKRRRVLSQFDDLQACYLRAHVQHAAAAAAGGSSDGGDVGLASASTGGMDGGCTTGGLTPLDDFAHTLSEFTRYRCVRNTARRGGQRVALQCTDVFVRAQPPARCGRAPAVRRLPLLQHRVKVWAWLPPCRAPACL
jgi:hypothetical protein